MPSKRKNILAGLVVLITSLSPVKAQGTNSNLESQLGLIDVGRQKEICFAIPNSTLAVGNRITLVAPNKRQATGTAVISRKLASSCSPNPATSEGLFFYTLRVTTGHHRFFGNSPSAPYVGIVGSFRSVTRKGKVSIDADGDGQRESFRTCTSSEGIHLTVWTGVPLKGKRRWHSYYYLGYDTVPTCKEGDYKE